MTFQDEVHHDNEVVAHRAVRHLQLWLSTIAPVSQRTSEFTLSELHSLCVEMDWPLERDEVLDREILTYGKKGGVKDAD